MIPDRNGNYKVWGSEAGHSMFGPGNRRQREFSSFLSAKYQIDAIWTEKMISGPAIPDIFEFISSFPKLNEKKDRKEQGEGEEGEKGEGRRKEEEGRKKGEEIFRRGLEGEEVCEETLRFFVELLGTEAGNMGIRMMPYGGIYFCGGIMKSIMNFVWETREDCFLVRKKTKKNGLNGVGTE